MAHKLAQTIGKKWVLLPLSEPFLKGCCARVILAMFLVASILQACENLAGETTVGTCGNKETSIILEFYPQVEHHCLLCQKTAAL